jgi:hypothetical protein
MDSASHYPNDHGHEIIDFPPASDASATVDPEDAGCDGDEKAAPCNNVCNDLQGSRHRGYYSTAQSTQCEAEFCGGAIVVR